MATLQFGKVIIFAFVLFAQVFVKLSKYSVEHARVQGSFFRARIIKFERTNIEFTYFIIFLTLQLLLLPIIQTSGGNKM